MCSDKQKNKRFIIFTLLFLAGLSCYAQIYVSPKTCATAISPAPGGGGNTGGGGNNQPVNEGCPDPVYLFDENTDAVSWTWNFGETDQLGNPVTMSGIRNPQHYYTTPGNYTIELTRELSSGLTEIETKNIQVHPALNNIPRFNDKTSADTTVCESTTLTLNPFKKNPLVPEYKYLWFPTGETTQTIDVDSSGCYSVEVFDPVTGCSRTAKINVKFCFEESSGGGGSEKWFFGNGASMEFTFNTEPVPRDTLSDDGDIFGTPEEQLVDIQPISGGSHQLNSEVNTAMVYGPRGLAFYSDGYKIFDGNDQEILDISGNSLGVADPTASQGLVIIPKIECASCSYTKYYVFHKDKSTGLLSYSIIDLRYNDGQGMITDRNIPVAYDITDRIGVIPGDDGFQLIIHGNGNNQIQYMQVDSSGVNTFTQSIGTAQDSGLENGQVAFDVNYSRMAHGVVIDGQSYVEILTRDESTGIFSNPILIPLTSILGTTPPGSNPPVVYGLAFSQTGNNLYATIQGSPISYLLQIPLGLEDPAAITANIQLIASSGVDRFGALQLGPVDPNQTGDKFIYMAVQGKDKLAYIQAPDLMGNASIVGYVNSSSGIEVNGTVGLGLPTIVYSPQEDDGSGISANYSGTCFDTMTSLNTEDICSPMRNQFFWEFEDGTTLTGKSVSYKFPKTGWNKITLRIKVFQTSPLKGIVNSQLLNQVIELTESECTEKIVLDSVYIKPAPIINLPDVSYICLADSILLGSSFTGNRIDPKVTGGGEPYSYLWMTIFDVPLGGGIDATAPILEVKVPATYRLQIENVFGCQAKSEFKLEEGCEPRIYIPDAINVSYTPNSELTVRAFHISNPNLKVYDRWGEVVFETENLDIRWDGRINGQVHPSTLYQYILQYNARDFPDRGRLKETGGVWVFQ
jgi:gliding motility-associated-like protein